MAALLQNLRELTLVAATRFVATLATSPLLGFHLARVGRLARACALLLMRAARYAAKQTYITCLYFSSEHLSWILMSPTNSMRPLIEVEGDEPLAPKADALETALANAMRNRSRFARYDAIFYLLKQPPRPFEADYPGAPNADEFGRLQTDIEGRPLLANDIAGRRMVQGDVPLPRSRTDGLTTAITGREVGRLNGGTDAGITYITRGPNGPEYEISVRPLPDSKGLGRDRTIRHEIGHVIDDIAGEIPTQGLTRDLTRIYDAQLSGRMIVTNICPTSAGRWTLGRNCFCQSEAANPGRATL